MNRKNLLSLCFVGLAFLVAACGDSASGGGATVTDSAGVQIIMSKDPGTWTDATRPTFSEVVRIGGSAADTNYQFGGVAGIDIDDRGEIYVLDALAQVVRVFDSSGKFLRTIGRKGSGPGELRGASALFVTRGDTLLVMDMGAQGLMRFGTDGSPRGKVEILLAEGIPAKLVERSDGSLVVQVRIMNLEALAAGLGARSRGGAPPPSMAPQADKLVVRSASGNVVDTVLTLPAGETMQMGGSTGMTMRLFAPEPMWSLTHDGDVFYGVNNEYSINVYDANGTLKRIVRRDVERKPVTDESKLAIKAAMIKAMTDAMAQRGMSAPQSMIDGMTNMLQFADYFPAVGNLLGGPDGTLWVQQARTAEELTQMAATIQTQDFGSSTWDVYGKDGKLLGSLKMPDNFVPLRWINDKLAGVQSDASGTPHAVILKLSTSPG